MADTDQSAPGPISRALAAFLGRDAASRCEVTLALNAYVRNSTDRDRDAHTNRRRPGCRLGLLLPDPAQPSVSSEQLIALIAQHTADCEGRVAADAPPMGA